MRTAKEQAQDMGFVNLSQVSELSSVSKQTLDNWSKSKPFLFEIVLRGCAVLVASDKAARPRKALSKKQINTLNKIEQYNLGFDFNQKEMQVIKSLIKAGYVVETSQGYMAI